MCSSDLVFFTSLGGVVIYLFIFIEVKLICNIVLVSGVQQSDSVIYIYIFFSDYFPLQVTTRC